MINVLLNTYVTKYAKSIWLDIEVAANKHASCVENVHTKNWTFDSGCALEIPKLFKDQWRLKDCIHHLIISSRRIHLISDQESFEVASYGTSSIVSCCSKSSS
jgi:hypothetical protein